MQALSPGRPEALLSASERHPTRRRSSTRERRLEGVVVERGGRRVRELSCGLLSLGLSAGETAAIVSATRIEWVLADLAILCAGA